MHVGFLGGGGVRFSFFSPCPPMYDLYICKVVSSIMADETE